MTRLALLRGTGWLLTAAMAVGVCNAQPSERFGGPRPGNGTPPANALQSRPTFNQQVEQTERRPAGNVKTLVEFTILLPRLGGAIDAQRWAKTFADLGVQAQFRGPNGADEPGIEEKVRGTLRSVKVVGELTTDGRLHVADRVYTAEDVRKLKEWVDSLQTYGAQGAPQGQPLWGLNESQFTAVYEALSAPVEAELEGQTLTAALQQFPLPAKHPLRRLSAADEWLAAHPGTTLENRVQGLSCGTALAVVLGEAGLGFSPARTPEGEIELHVQPLAAGGQVWPVGWELPPDVDHGTLVPVLHKFLEIGFDDAALQDVLDAAAAAMEVPFVVDYYRVRGTGVDLAERTVSYPAKRTTWALMLNSIIRKANLVKDVRVDEQGRPLLYITPFVPTAVER